MPRQASLGSRLRAARKDHSVTQRQIADACHVTEATVNKWEYDETVPALEHLPAIAELLPSLSEADLAIARSKVFVARAVMRLREAEADLEATRAQYGLPG
jgi:transcriptional regulator with XRE-family HTH domain